MDKKELEIIERRIGGTTPAPWITGSIPWQVWCDGGHGKICRVESCASDREFIAHARQDVPALLDEVRKLNLQNEEYRKALNRIALLPGLPAVRIAVEVLKLTEKRKCDKHYAMTEDTYGYCGREIGHDGDHGRN